MDKVRHLRRSCLTIVLGFSYWCLLAGSPVFAQDILSKEAYLMPPKEIADAVLAARHENVTLNNLSPDGKKFLITKTDGLPTLERMACPCVYLGEMAFDPMAHRSRDLWIKSAAGFEIFYYADQRKVRVQLPDKARVSNPAWSPDSSTLAFFTHFENATYVYLADTVTGNASRLTQIPVLATLATTFQWSKDGKHIQTVLLPDDGKRETPKHDAVALEPKVRVTRGGANPSRTYRFLLESPHDMKLLEYLATGQLALVDVKDGKVTRVGEPSMIRSVQMAPSGEEFRVTTMKKPFSYFVPAARFGSLESIWDAKGKNLYTLAEKTYVKPSRRRRRPSRPRVGKGRKWQARAGPTAASTASGSGQPAARYPAY